MQKKPILQSQVSLAPYTSFKAGGEARYFIAPQTTTELKDAWIWARSENIPVFLLGKGTNLVFSDQGYSGLVIYTPPHLNNIRWENEEVFCDAGALVYSAVVQSVKRGLAGIQKLGGIPGTLGGAAYMNAGAYGQEVCETITHVISVNAAGEVLQRKNSECDFRYRHSKFWELEELIIEVQLKLRPGEKTGLEKEMRASLADRKEKQPLNLPNSGSVFKRPAKGYPGEVIEKAGLKGLRVGDAEVSPKHGNFIINRGKATAQDLFDLSEQIKEKVYQHSGVELEREVFLVGDFLPWPR